VVVGLSLQDECCIVVGGSWAVEGIVKPFLFMVLAMAARATWMVPVLTLSATSKVTLMDSFSTNLQDQELCLDIGIL